MIYDEEFGFVDYPPWNTDGEPGKFTLFVNITVTVVTIDVCTYLLDWIDTLFR